MMEPSHGPTATHRREAGSGQSRSAAHCTSAGPKRWLSPMTSLARFGTIVGSLSRFCLSRPGITASLFPITPPSRPGSMEDRFPKAEMARAIPQQPPIGQSPGPCDPRRPLTVSPGPAIPHRISIAPSPGPGPSRSGTHGMTAPIRLTEVA